jgi:hypothetical protein
MKTVILIIFSVLLTFNVKSQIFSKNDFANTEWFTNNYDSLFFKSDTVALIKYSNLISDNLSFNEYSESEQKFLNHGYYIHLQFYKNGQMNFWVISYEKSSKSKVGERTWKFNKEKNALEIKNNKIIEFELTPLSKNEIELESQYAKEKNTIKTMKIILVKRK